MSRIIFLSSFFISIFYSPALFAQNFDIVTYDSSLKRFDKELVFDKPFTMLIPYNDNVSIVRYVRHDKGVNLYTSIRRQYRRGIKNPLRRIIESNISSTHKDGKKYMNIFFGFDQSVQRPYKGRNDVLRPNRDYTILLPTLSKESFEIFKLIHEGKTTEAQLIIGQKIFEEATKQDSVVITSKPYDSAKKLYVDHLVTKFLEIDRLNRKLQDPARYTYPFTGGFTNLLSEVLTLNDGTHLFDPTVKNMVIAVTKFKKLNPSNFVAITKGDAGFEVTQPAKPPTPLQNLALLETLTVQLIDTITILNSRFPFTISQISHLSELITYLSLVKENISFYKAIDKEKKNITDLAYARTYYIDYINLTGESTVLTFDTRNKFQLTPEFGLVGYGFWENYRGLMPYIGLHINFSYVHKDYPYWKVPDKTLLRRSSIMLAWGLISVNSDGRRTDFFKNSPLLIGWGYRLTNAVRFVAGPMIFYRYEAKPFATEKTLTTAAFAGISIDLNVRQFVSTITDVIIPK